MAELWLIALFRSTILRLKSTTFRDSHPVALRWLKCEGKVAGERGEPKARERLARRRERSLAFIWIFVMKMASATAARGENRKIKRRIE